MTSEAAGADATLSDGADAVLAGFRQSIDNIDAAMIHILAERFRITQAVGAYKAANRLPPSDPAREERQIARRRVFMFQIACNTALAMERRQNIDPLE